MNALKTTFVACLAGSLFIAACGTGPTPVADDDGSTAESAPPEEDEATKSSEAITSGDVLDFLIPTIKSENEIEAWRCECTYEDIESYASPQECIDSQGISAAHTDEMVQCVTNIFASHELEPPSGFRSALRCMDDVTVQQDQCIAKIHAEYEDKCSEAAQQDLSDCIQASFENAAPCEEKLESDPASLEWLMKVDGQIGNYDCFNDQEPITE